MKFKKEFLQEEIYSENVVQDNIIGKRRWSVDHECIFKHDGKFYRTTYEVGATEYQDGQPYQDAGDEIECKEVFAKEKVITVYE